LTGQTLHPHCGRTILLDEKYGKHVLFSNYCDTFSCLYLIRPNQYCTSCRLWSFFSLWIQFIYSLYLISYSSMPWESICRFKKL